MCVRAQGNQSYFSPTEQYTYLCKPAYMLHTSAIFLIWNAMLAAGLGFLTQVANTAVAKLASTLIVERSLSSSQ